MENQFKLTKNSIQASTVHNKMFNDSEINLPAPRNKTKSNNEKRWQKKILEAIFQIALLFTTLWLIIALDFYYLQIFEANRDKKTSAYQI